MSNQNPILNQLANFLNTPSLALIRNQILEALKNLDEVGIPEQTKTKHDYTIAILQAFETNYAVQSDEQYVQRKWATYLHTFKEYTAHRLLQIPVVDSEYRLTRKIFNAALGIVTSTQGQDQSKRRLDFKLLFQILMAFTKDLEPEEDSIPLTTVTFLFQPSFAAIRQLLLENIVEVTAFDSEKRLVIVLSLFQTLALLNLQDHTIKPVLLEGLTHEILENLIYLASPDQYPAVKDQEIVNEAPIDVFLGHHLQMRLFLQVYSSKIGSTPQTIGTDSMADIAATFAFFQTKQPWTPRRLIEYKLELPQFSSIARAITQSFESLNLRVLQNEEQVEPIILSLMNMAESLSAIQETGFKKVSWQKFLDLVKLILGEIKTKTFTDIDQQPTLPIKPAGHSEPTQPIQWNMFCEEFTRLHYKSTSADDPVIFTLSRLDPNTAIEVLNQLQSVGIIHD